MEGKGPYRIYDPGGARDVAVERLVEENAALKERMKGIKSLGELLEESQLEASKLRQRVEDLVKENKVLGSSPPSSLEQQGAPQTTPPEGHDQILDSFVLPDRDEKEQERAAKSDQKSPGSGNSSEFEIVPADEKGSSHGSGKSELEPQPFLQNGGSNLLLHLQRLEMSLSEFAEEPDRNQLFTHLGRMALEFNRLAGKVHKNEQRTSILQTLCEQLREENEDLRRKLEKDLEQRNRAREGLRVENVELKRQVTTGREDGVKVVETKTSCEPIASGAEVKLEGVQQQQSGKALENVTGKDVLGATEKKVKALEHQRNELLEVNKQWDKHFRSMKQQYEQKITLLRQKLADSQKLVGDLEAEREQKQRDFDRKLLLARSKIETEEGEKEALEAEVKELRQKNRFLQDQLSPVSRQREYQEKEIQRLNKALEEALSVQASAPPPSVFSTSAESGVSLRRQEQLTQIDLLKQQVKIFEEDFQRERNDRERMSEEKEDLRQEMEKLQVQITQQNTQLRVCKEDLQREKGDKEKLRKLRKQHKQAMGERFPPVEHRPGAMGPMLPPYQYPYAPPIPPCPMYQGFEDWQIHYPPAERPPVQDSRHLPPPECPWWVQYRITRNPTSPGGEGSRAMSKESDSSAIATPKKQHPI